MVNFGIYSMADLEQYLPDMYSASIKEAYMIILAGPMGLTHYVGNQKIELPPHAILFLGAGRSSQFDRSAVPDAHILLFGAKFFARSTRLMHFLQQTPLFNDHTNVYYMTLSDDGVLYSQVFIRLFDLAISGLTRNMLSMDLAHNLLEQVLIIGSLYYNVVSANYEANRDSTLVTEYKALVNMHYATQKSVQFYAAQLNVTARRLNQATMKELGVHAKNVITSCITQKARQLLAYTDHNMKEISASLGFSGEHNFSDFFYKNAGRRPSEFRKVKQTEKQNVTEM